MNRNAFMLIMLYNVVKCTVTFIMFNMSVVNTRKSYNQHVTVLASFPSHNTGTNVRSWNFFNLTLEPKFT
jgi:hypothetical protein